MTLDDYLEVGQTVTIGLNHFDPASIIAFAKKFDPQPFHLSEETAKGSVFGALCASGWHTAAAWMKCNIAAGFPPEGIVWTGDGPAPQFGPSPGFKNLKWLKPVFAGETVTYTRKVTGHRPLLSRPGWHVFTSWNEGFDSTGDKVIEFESAALVKAG